MIKEKNIRLDAPNKTRYQNLFKDIKAGDLVLHYLTGALTFENEKKSKITALSKIASNPTTKKGKIIANCASTIVFPDLVPYSKLYGIGRKSKELDKLLRRGMQQYLTKISLSDFKSILEISPANKKRFSKSNMAKWFKTIIK